MAQQATTATANGPIYGGANNGTLTGLGTADQRRALYLKLFSWRDVQRISAQYYR